MSIVNNYHGVTSIKIGTTKTSDDGDHCWREIEIKTSSNDNVRLVMFSRVHGNLAVQDMVEKDCDCES